jgi:hypothetical protein
MCLKAFKTRFTLLKAILFPGFNPITPVFKSRVAYPRRSSTAGAPSKKD